MKVVYIVGKGRSGSTIVGDFLGSLDGAFHAGELNKLWEYCLLGPHSCSCGETMPSCVIWSEVMRLARQDERCAWSFKHPGEMVALQHRWITFTGFAKSAMTRADSSRYIQTMNGVYDAIQTVTGCETLIDGSKWALDPRILSPHANSENRVLHVVRDPRSVATSWQKSKIMPDTQAPMPRFGAVHTSLSWSARVLASEWVRRNAGAAGYMLQFEHVENSVENTLSDVARFCGLDASGGLRGGDTVEINPGHSVMGNPTRFTTGTVQIKRSGNTSGQPVVSLMTYPARLLVGMA